MCAMSTILDDKKTILDLGGPTEVARLLGLDTAKGGVQRVQNWMTRGIPPKEKLARPDLFLLNFPPADLVAPDPAPVPSDMRRDRPDEADRREADPSRSEPHVEGA